MCIYTYMIHLCVHTYVCVCVSFLWLSCFPLFLSNCISTCKMTTQDPGQSLISSFFMMSAGPPPQRNQCYIHHENSRHHQDDTGRPSFGGCTETSQHPTKKPLTENFLVPMPNIPFGHDKGTMICNGSGTYNISHEPQ